MHASSDDRVYLDYAAATPVDERVLSAMQPFWRESFANPSAQHAEGRAAHTALESARKKVATLLSVRQQELTFTSGGTEANNLAIVGVISALRRKHRGEHFHLITSAIEHPSVLEVFRRLAGDGDIDVSYIDVDSGGRVDLRALKAALRPETALVSVMYANSEIGVVQPLREVARTLQRHREETGGELPYLHTDASQAPLYLDIKPEHLGADLLSLDGQKCYGPKGVGVLFHRRTVPMEPLILGGGQEGGMRSGTGNVPLVVGFAEALSIATAERDTAVAVAELRDYCIEELERAVPEIIINGSREHRLANNVSVTIAGTDAEYLAARMDTLGVAVSTGSACSSADGESSHVLAALGGDTEAGAIRITLGKETTRAHIDRAVEALLTSLG